MENKARIYGALQLYAAVTDILESGVLFHFGVALSCLSSWWFHLIDIECHLMNFIDWPDIELVTSLEFVSLQGVDLVSVSNDRLIFTQCIARFQICFITITLMYRDLVALLTCLYRFMISTDSLNKVLLKSDTDIFVIV